MKKRASIILFLLLVWLGFSSDFSIINIVLGIIVATCVNLLIVPTMEIKINLKELITLSAYVFVELIRSTIQVGRDILSSVPQNKPEIIHLTFKPANIYQISLLSNMVSLTPGTLTIDIDEQKKEMVIHIMFSQDKIDIINFIENKLEPLVLKVIQDA